MNQSVPEKLGQGPMFDMAIVEHHFTPYMRDYDIIVDVTAAVPGEQRSYIEGRYRYRFTHCVVSEVTTAIRDEVWGRSWGDGLLDYQEWVAADQPDGYVWGVCWMLAYPGLAYVSGSAAARDWGERLGHQMHEVFIETNGHNIRLIFHDVGITKIAHGDAQTGDLIPLAGESATGAV